MAGSKSSSKGAAFELLIAKAVLKQFPRFTEEDCHRTPKSGGHPYESSSDLRLSPEFRRVFPYAVECKHHKSFKIGQMWPKPSALVLSWLLQTEKAAKEEGRIPILVMRGNFTPIYVALPADPSIFGYKQHITLEIDDARLQHNFWAVLPFEDWISSLPNLQ